MTSIEQFFAHYFLDRTKLIQEEIEFRLPHRQSYFAPDCRWDSRQGTVESSQAEQIVSVSQADGETVVVTTGKHHKNTSFPLRYHLRPNGDSWLIHDVEFACPGCHGTGRAQHGDTTDEPCRFCGGKGWK
jgi:hypothetical protein